VKDFTLQDVKFDCRHFRGDVPCKPNKLRNKVCPTCDEYDAVQTRILIIKLGAVGDVIRTTPLIQKLREVYPHAHIAWITHTPEVVPSSCVDKTYRFDFRGAYSVSHLTYDVAINLDKDIEACALLSNLNASRKFGFTLQDGRVGVANALAEHKLLTGMFDGLSKANTRNYLQEIFEICGFSFNGEPYVLDIDAQWEHLWEPIRTMAGERAVVGLNTGCGDRWLTRLWPEAYWVELIERLHRNGYFPLLLGGPAEDAQNRLMEEKTGAYYPGTFTLPQFIALSAQCDVILTAVTMMMHIALGARVPLVLFNNIFNPNEFELYGRGEMLQPTSGCDCYFGNTCTRRRHCMYDISVDAVYAAVTEMASRRS
jgi:heptosyltransferase-2